MVTKNKNEFEEESNPTWINLNNSNKFEPNQKKN